MAIASLLLIEFSDCQVSVATDQSTAEQLRKRFALMIGDGCDSVIARFEARQEQGVYRLIENSALVSVEHSIENLIETLVHKVAERFIESFSSLHWFHAAVMARNEQAIMLPAIWGNGKSSLAVALANAGWTYLSDDLAPLEPGVNKIHPYPRTPTVRSHSGQVLPRDRISELTKTETFSENWSVAIHPLPLHSVVFPRYQFRGGCKLTECRPEEAVVELLSHCLNFSVNSSKVVAYLARLIPEIKPFELTFSDATAAASLLTSVFELPVSKATGQSR